MVNSFFLCISPRAVNGIQNLSTGPGSSLHFNRRTCSFGKWLPYYSHIFCRHFARRAYRTNPFEQKENLNGERQFDKSHIPQGTSLESCDRSGSSSSSSSNPLDYVINEMEILHGGDPFVMDDKLHFDGAADQSSVRLNNLYKDSSEHHTPLNNREELIISKENAITKNPESIHHTDFKSITHSPIDADSIGKAVVGLMEEQSGLDVNCKSNDVEYGESGNMTCHSFTSVGNLKSEKNVSLTPAQRFYLDNKEILLQRVNEIYSNVSEGSVAEATDEVIDSWAYYRNPVVRPPKGHMWDYRASKNSGDDKKVLELKAGEMPSVEELSEILRMEQCMNISCVDLDLIGRRDLGVWAIVATVNTASHGLKVATLIAHAVRRLRIAHVSSYAVYTHGYRDQPWRVVRLGSTVLHLMTGDTRELYKLEELFIRPHVSFSDDCGVNETEVNNVSYLTGNSVDGNLFKEEPMLLASKSSVISIGDKLLSESSQSYNVSASTSERDYTIGSPGSPETVNQSQVMKIPKATYIAIPSSEWEKKMTSLEKEDVDSLMSEMRDEKTRRVSEKHKNRKRTRMF